MTAIASDLERAVELSRAYWDVVLDRVESPEPPAWAETRGWTEWLLSLAEDDVAFAERSGLLSLVAGNAAAPASLRTLCESTHALTAPFARGPSDLPAVEALRVKLRKRTQVAAVVETSSARWPGLRRVIELGSGHGHATRGLRVSLGVEALGVERDIELVRTARALGDESGTAFAHCDAFTAPRLDLGPGDLLLGLHACGSLGDVVVERAADAGSHVLLVSCCLQKMRGELRAPLSRRGRELGLALPRWVLGLTNLAWGSGADGAAEGRATRRALQLLLAARGMHEDAGDEAHGINRRRFRRGLAAVAAPALVRRGLPPASEAELDHHRALGAQEFARMRRLSLPRNLLGRVLELAAALDRAAYLEERGYQVSVEPIFDVEVSPRNLGVIALAPHTG